MRGWGDTVGLAVAFLSLGTAIAVGAELLIGPAADGTIVDGGSFGAFDGQPDQADWSFNDTGYDGLITRSQLEGSGLEHRLVFEFDLRSITFVRPVSASLTFNLRGSTRFPAETAPVGVIAYSGDLVQQLADFGSAPLRTVGVVPIRPFQPSSSYTINVSNVVNERLDQSAVGVGFRFQIDAGMSMDAYQAFMDALDSDIDTKPRLLVTDRVPGDFNGDRLLTEADAGIFAGCIQGPGITVFFNCRPCDFDFDFDVDLVDYLAFTHASSLYRH